MICKLMQTFVCVMVLISASHAGAGEVTSLVITDFHLNPFHGLSKAEFKELAATPANQWQAVIVRLRQPIVPLGSDSNFTLMNSALTAAAEQAEKPDFILFAGDFMAHDWQSRYNACAHQSIADDPQAYQEFTVKVLQFIAGVFQERFPDTAILPTLGNDDAFCQGLLDSARRCLPERIRQGLETTPRGNHRSRNIRTILFFARMLRRRSTGSRKPSLDCPQ